MNKRIFWLAVGALLFALCVPAEAQQPGKILRIGFLDVSTASGMAGLLETFRQELSKLGWTEGKNLTIEYRFAENKGSERLPELVAELVRLKVDLIVASGTPPADAVPKLVRVGLLRPPGSGIMTALQLKELRAAAQALKLKLEEIDTQPDLKGIENAFKETLNKSWEMSSNFARQLERY